MAEQALIVWGGWEGHEPAQVAERFRATLTAEGFEVTVADSLDAFANLDSFEGLRLIVPVWTMGRITKEQLDPVLAAVQSGVGLAGCHGGMCDAFREATDWHFMTGGQWVAHPGNDGVRYRVKIGPQRGAINEGVADFEVASEQYYLHVDPAVKVWATTTFPAPGVEGPHVANGPVEMPQVWTKTWGRGRVFYNALGHHADVFDVPEAMELMRRGMLWASGRIDG